VFISLGESKVLFSVCFLLSKEKENPSWCEYYLLKGCSDKTMKTHDSRATWVLHWCFRYLADDWVQLSSKPPLLLPLPLPLNCKGVLDRLSWPKVKFWTWSKKWIMCRIRADKRALLWWAFREWGTVCEVEAECRT
jgi:hypothetical protein